jgi:hypothetical protein
MDAFDMLKNNGLDMNFICTVFDFKIIPGIGQTGGHGTRQKLNSCRSLNHETTFYLCTNCLKY